MKTNIRKAVMDTVFTTIIIFAVTAAADSMNVYFSTIGAYAMFMVCCLLGHGATMIVERISWARLFLGVFSDGKASKTYAIKELH